MERKGVIYILTNSSFPDYVKIGYADDAQKRETEPNRSVVDSFVLRLYDVTKGGKYIFNLFLSLITVSLETLKLIDELPTYEKIK